ncbi:MAG TPA: AraC family transcriptional regulator [Solimonas sp.]
MPPTPTTATALTSWAKAIRKALDAAEVDSARLFAEAGLDPVGLDDPNARYPVAATTRLWELAVRATGDDAFGLTVARHVSQTTFHALGYSLAASSTLKEAFERLLRYFRIVTDAADLQLDEDTAHLTLILHVDPARAVIAPQALDAFAYLLLRLCRGLYRRDAAPVSVTLCRPPPRNRAAFERAFRAPLCFGADENRLVFERALFEQRLEGANPELARHNDEIVLRYLARHDRDNLVARVRAVLTEQLPSGEPSEAAVAVALHLSSRSLQRKLAEEGSSYTALLTQTRRDLAHSYLRGGRHSVGEIAYLLGFADTSSFTRAFRRWEGCAPSAFREREAAAR